MSPVVLRAQMLKAEIKDLENLRHKLEQRETIIKVKLRMIGVVMCSTQSASDSWFVRYFLGS